MRANRLKQIWSDGGHVVVGWLSLTDSYSAELMARQGFDAICIDMQHGLTDFAHLPAKLQGISQTDAVPIVRVPWNDPAILMRVLDAGAYGVIVPLVNNRAEAEQAVKACRYPPDGFRSFGPMRASLYAGADYAIHANDEILVFAMIETAEGLRNLDEICSTPGLDGIYVGPADLSYALGLPPRMDSTEPTHVKAVADVIAACKRHGIVAGIHTGGPAYARHIVKEGMGLVTLTSETRCIEIAARQQLTEFRGTETARKGTGPY